MSKEELQEEIQSLVEALKDVHHHLGTNTPISEIKKRIEAALAPYR